MNILIAADKFKGSLTSRQVGEALLRGLRRRFPAASIRIFPMADGGDGFDEVMGDYFSLERCESATVDPLGRPLQAGWSWDSREATAFIAVAAASGLALLAPHERNPLRTSSFGTGLLIRAALEKGAQRVVLGLGGSSTNDAGMGILAALGFQLLDDAQQPVPPNGGHLRCIRKILPPSPPADVVFDIAVDVTNPLFGPTGAAYIYGPQKGADAAMVEELDKGLRSLAPLLSAAAARDITAIPGLGAAGGMAAGLLPYFTVNMQPGIDRVLEASGFPEALKDADLVITGEGKLDGQSSQGKVVGRIVALCRQQQVPCMAVCGVSEWEENQWRREGLEQVLAIRPIASSDEDAMQNAASYLTRMAESLTIA